MTSLPARALVRLPLRALSALLIAVGVATCSDTPPVAVKHASIGPDGGTSGRIAFAPIFSAAALQTAQHLADFGIQYDRVRVVLVRIPSDTAKDTTLAFAPGTPDLTLNLTVAVRSSNEVFDVGISFLSSKSVVFQGQGRVRSHEPDEPVPPQEQIAIDYVGPGANVARIALAPKTTVVPFAQALAFTVNAFDAANNPVPSVPLSWSTSDPTIATITSTGTLQALGRRGNIVVTATTPTGISDRATVTIAPPPASIAVVDGSGQTAIVKKTLTTPGSVQVNAADGIGVPGVVVTFAAPAGGAVGSTTVTTDANGRASTSLTLGPTAGQQIFSAAAGNFNVALPETALADAPAAIAVISGNSQTDTVRKTLAPLVVRVTDQFDNPVSGVTVSWTRSAGSGALGAGSSTTGSDGRATMTYTLGSVVGAEGVTASVSGVSGHASFAFQAVAAGPAAIVIVSGNRQSGRVGTTLFSEPLVVKVVDDIGSPVSGATINWTATNGNIAPTTSSDADGRSSATLTLGLRAGQVTATATISNGKAVTFVATALAGVPAVAVFSTQPTNAVAGATMSAVRVTLFDSYGNQTNAASPVSIAIGNNAGGGALSGTLTRTSTNGVATFNDLKIDKAGVGYTLVASSGNLAPVTSRAFTISAPIIAANLIIVDGDNQRGATGSPVPIAPSVKVTDESGNPVSGASVTFTPADGDGTVVPSSAILTDANGIAAASSWNLGAHAGPQSLTASSPGLTSVVFHASAFAGPPVMLGMATQPSATALSGVALDRQPAVQLLDHFGNPTATTGLTVSVSVSSGSLLGTTSVIADPTTGLASFADLGIVGTGVVTLTFSANGLQSVTSSSITVSSGAPPTN